MKQVKESRKLDTEIVVKVMEDKQILIEVSDDEAPHVLTNDPTFFTSHKNKVIKEDRGKILFC